ncbi:MAG TPA: ABC transporter permease [Ignavibacteria bacterium]|nr:ABC transporter permease [Ignavibacteria bacterium]HQY51921.1 ABC transporter permease [Ignavibacteria bacterium]HRA99321.1 ABC transporter permease [Ignavibacteria bacterium]
MEVETAVVADSILQEEQSKSLWHYSWKRLKRNKLAMTGLVTLCILIFIALTAPLIAPFNPNMQILEYSAKEINFKGTVFVKKDADTDSDEASYIPVKRIIRESGSEIVYMDFIDNEVTVNKDDIEETSEGWTKTLTYYLGTDRFGRDVLSRLIYGSRVSLTVGLVSESIAIFLGLILGAIAGFYRGKVDVAVMWLVNVIFAFPAILLIIALSVVLGKGLWQAFIAIGLTGWVDIARIVRGQFFSLRETEFVEATKAIGFNSVRVITRHILPNCMGPVIVTGTVGLASAIIFEASLSFLGLGVQPPTASWGQMIFDGYKYIVVGTNWGLAVFPSIAIMLTVFAVNLLGDGLRDAFDPKLKR